MCVHDNCLRNAETMPQCLLIPSSPVRKHKADCQSLDYLFAILGTMISKNLPVNAVTDIPVQFSQFSIDINGNTLS